MKIDLSGRRVALIGGGGFIGHNLALNLLGKGAKVTIVDSFQVNNLLSFRCDTNVTKTRDLYANIIDERFQLLRDASLPIYIQDARDYHALSRVLTDIQPEVIVHLAAVSHAGRSNKDPYSTFDHSLRTLENALDWSKDGRPHFIYFSSSMAYGSFLTAEVDEEHPLNPMGIYGALKAAGELIVKSYQQVFDLPYTIIRPSALYGPRCVSRRVGQIFIENALAGVPLRVEGDGQEKLDFTFIDDLSEGIACAIDRPAARNEVFNLTYGASRSIAELAGIIQEHFPEAAVENVKRDHLMPFRGTLSVAKAKSLLGYRPANPIDIGFPKYIEWYRDFTWHRDALQKAKNYLAQTLASLMRIEPDNWLAGVLGEDAYRIVVGPAPAGRVCGGCPADLEDPFGGERPRSGFYYAKVPTADVATVRALCAAGLYVVDVSISLERAPELLPAPALPVREVQPHETDAVLAIAGSCFVYSRFHLDPLVPDAAAHRIKREWIDSYLHGRRGERLLVVDVDGEPAGFLAVLSARVASEPCRVIDLIGVDSRFQGRGAGKALVQQFIGESAGKRTRLRVGTQVANLPSTRLYEQCGFRLAESAYVLHGHF